MLSGKREELMASNCERPAVYSSERKSQTVTPRFIAAELTKARMALSVCNEQAEKWQTEAARLRCLEADVTRLGAPETFLDAIRRMRESFEDFESAYRAAVIGCHAALDAAHEKPINAERAMAALDIFKGAINFPDQARLRALAVRLEIQPGWLAGAEVMKRLNSPYWNANYP
jgi:hypothetical protein